MNNTIIALSLAAAVAAPATPPAASAERTALITASFSRILSDTERGATSRVAKPVATTGVEDDPLYQALTSRVWDLQPGHCAFQRS